MEKKVHQPDADVLLRTNEVTNNPKVGIVHSRAMTMAIPEAHGRE